MKTLRFLALIGAVMLSSSMVMANSSVVPINCVLTGKITNKGQPVEQIQKHSEVWLIRADSIQSQASKITMPLLFKNSRYLLFTTNRPSDYVGNNTFGSEKFQDDMLKVQGSQALLDLETGHFILAMGGGKTDTLYYQSGTCTEE